MPVQIRSPEAAAAIRQERRMNVDRMSRIEADHKLQPSREQRPLSSVRSENRAVSVCIPRRGKMHERNAKAIRASAYAATLMIRYDRSNLEVRAAAYGEVEQLLKS